MADDLKLNRGAPADGSDEIRRLVAPDTIVRSNELLVIVKDSDGLRHLTEASVEHFRTRMAELATQVLHEARGIESDGHAGSGPPEVTAAHIDEAFWVTRRRIRHQRHPIALGFVRVFEALGTTAVGAAIPYIKSTEWGPICFVASMFIAMGAFLTETYLSRKE